MSGYLHVKREHPQHMFNKHRPSTCRKTALHAYPVTAAGGLGRADSWPHSGAKAPANAGVPVRSFSSYGKPLTNGWRISFEKEKKEERRAASCQILIPKPPPKAPPKLQPKAIPRVEAKGNYTLLEEININKTKHPPQAEAASGYKKIFVFKRKMTPGAPGSAGRAVEEKTTVNSLTLKQWALKKP